MSQNKKGGITSLYKPKPFKLHSSWKIGSKTKLEKKKQRKEREECMRQINEALEEFKTYVDHPGSSLISDKIVSEQPMSDPSGLLFYMDFPIMQGISTSATILNNANTTQRLNKKARKKKDEGDTK